MSDPLVSETRESLVSTEHIDFEYVLIKIKILMAILGLSVKSSLPQKKNCRLTRDGSA